jgi:trimeric autotransporter adhesin
MKRFRPRLTYANVIASLALFIALGGAAVAAGLPRNSVGPKQIKKGAVTSRAIRKNAVTAGKIGPFAVLPSNLGNGIIDKSKISAGAVTAEKIANNTVTTNKLNNGAVTSQKVAVNGIAATNIAEGAVTAPKLGKSSVTAEKLAPEVLNNVAPLKSGQTERGVFDIGGTDASATKAATARGAISLQQALLNTPAVTIVKKGGATTPACPGLGGGGTTPEAAAGNLCVYLTAETALDAVAPLVAESSNRLGTGLVAKSTAAEGDFAATGVWAVTAP